MISVPDDVSERLRQFGQQHVLAWWDGLADVERGGLLDQLKCVDLEQLRQLYSQRERTYAVPAFDRISPIPIQSPENGDPAERRLGEESLRRGETAVLVVAGGQGSRLGFEHPKGMFPIGPVSNKSLFQIHAEKVLALRRRHGGSIPFLVMTSPSNRQETESFFRDHAYFGLSAEEVFFFQQGTMPALDLATGKLLLESRGSLFLSPNGHGGTLLALAESGLLDLLLRRGIRQVFYFQVDNPLVKIADPAFLGHHLGARAEVSTKVVGKNSPEDRLGNLVLVDGRCAMIEYSDLPKELGRQTDDAGRLRFRAGNTAIHIFDLDFLERVTRSADRIPFHVARKKVPYLDAAGQVVEPKTENALKFEMFIFDVLPRAQRWTVVETSREEEFEPLKNATGPESPESVRRAMTALAADWLSRAGIAVPHAADGRPAFPLEISPLVALDAEELAAKVARSLQIRGPVCLDDRVTG